MKVLRVVVKNIDTDLKVFKLSTVDRPSTSRAIAKIKEKVSPELLGLSVSLMERESLIKIKSLYLIHLHDLRLFWNKRFASLIRA